MRGTRASKLASAAAAHDHASLAGGERAVSGRRALAARPLGGRLQATGSAQLSARSYRGGGLVSWGAHADAPTLGDAA